MICILVLWLPIVTADPVPLTLERRRRLHSLLPQREILDWSGLAAPASRNPAGDPRPHPFDNVLGVAREDDAKLTIHPLPFRERFDHRTQSHPVVRRRRLGNPVVPARELS